MSKIRDISIAIGIFIVPLIFAYILALVIKAIGYIFDGWTIVDFILLITTLIALEVFRRNR